VPTATAYRLQISTNSGFSSKATTAYDLQSAQYVLNSVQANTTLYWRVLTRIGTQLSAWSPAWSFSTAPIPVPTLTAPANLATGVTAPITFTWSAVPTATAYRLQISTNSGFTSKTTTVYDLQSAQYILKKSAANTTLYWRVLTRIGSQLSAWSPVWSLTSAANATPAATN
jgi:hypothetical protein